MPRAPLLLLLILLVPLGTAAAPPATVDLASLGFAPAETPTADVTYGNSEFNRAASGIRGSAPVLADLLRSLQSFRLLQYSQPATATQTAATDLLAGLPAKGWLLSQSESQEARQVSVYALPDGTSLDALIIVGLEPGIEVSVALIVGNIDPQELVALGLPLPQ